MTCGLSQIKENDCENKIKKGLPIRFNEFNYIKSIGFSDKKLSELSNLSEKMIRKRSVLKIFPVYKKLILAPQNLNPLPLICILLIKEIFL